MALAPSANIQEARKLAQSCWSRCKDSPSSFKLLAVSVRTLRNTLEEVEEIYDDFRTLGPDDLKLLDNVIKASTTLQQLDQALKNYQSNNDIRESDVADFKTSLDVIAHQLVLAFEAVTTGEIPLQLDTSVRTIVPSRGPSTSSHTGDSALDRKSSQASSAWSSVQKDSPSVTDTGSEIEDAKVEPKTRISVDKEGRTFRKPSFQSLSPTPSSTTSEGRKPSLDWRSPFASPDPLSISIEEASSLILSPDENEPPTSAARSRSGTGSTVFAQPPAQETVEGDSKSASNDNLPDDGSTPVELQSQVTKSPPDSPSLARAEEKPLPPLPQPPASAESSLTIKVPLRRLSESTFLSPASAATPAARRRAESLNSSKKSLEDIRTQSQFKGAVTSSVVDEDQKSPTDTTTGGSKDSTTFADTPEHDVSTPAAPATENNAPVTLPQTPPRTSTPPPLAASPQASPAKSPPVPNRKPPPPPPSPRRSKAEKAKARVSSYRIVNASPVDESSDDELYSVSQPTSPVQSTGPPVLPLIPHVSIADHDEVQTSETVSQAQHVDSLDLFEQATTKALAEESMNVPPVSTPPSTEDGNAQAESETIPTTAIDDRSDQDGSAIEEGKPELPKPPTRYKRFSDRPHVATMMSNMTSKIQKAASSYIQKETAPEPGLEVRGKLDAQSGLELNDGIRTRQSSKIIRERKSTEALLDVAGQSSSTASTAKPSTPHLKDRSASTSQLPQIEWTPPSTAVTEWYGPGSDRTELSDLERERISHIVYFWNDTSWEQAEAYLSDYLSNLLEENQVERARRVRHLLGVSASLRGEWERAIPLFLSAIRRPIHDISQLDDGDCAAAYWLGDIYALSNRRTEALIAYCVAERSSFFHSNEQLSAVSTLIELEQEAVQLGASKNDFKLRWSQQAVTGTSPDKPLSILDTNVITKAAAKMLLENEPRKYGGGRPPPRDATATFHLDGNKFRSNSFYLLTHPTTQPGYFHRLKLHSTSFEPHAPWPLQYDPTFSIYNVQQGRLLPYECDLLSLFTTNDLAKMPKSPSSKSLSHVNCFTSPDLPWLIRTLRQCLTLYGMQWSEVANVEGTRFLARYSFMLNKVATTNYFSIALFKQSLRPGFGVEIAAEGMGSARVLRTLWDFEKGVQNGEGKRVRGLVKEFLEWEAKMRGKGGRKGGGSAEGGGGVAGAAAAVEREAVLQEEEKPPPMPPRPTAAG